MEWRYFRWSRTARYQLYRFPANGKDLFRQKLDDVEIYRQDGSWHGGQREHLIDEVLKGWFDEGQDEISEEQAVLLMSEISDR